MPEATQEITVFPTVISVGLFPAAATLNPALEKRIGELLAETRLSKTQTVDRLHEMPEFAPLVEFFRAQIAARFEKFAFKPVEFFLTSCWANVQERGDALKYHTHANSYLSGTYYVRAPKGCGALEFLDPRATGYQFDIEVREMNLLNADAFSLAPRPGMLVLFPSSLVHG
ncbi:MAG: hypothetical protein HY057_12750, partial [Rhodospirillales bacterium]|nr:hypothetical protein [Rhodospirillales bacterium]